MKTPAAFLVVTIIWLAGLLAFAARVQHSTPTPLPSRADGVVVLTGANTTRRIAAAVGLLENGLGDRVLVSGVNRDVSREQMRQVSGAARRLYDCCVDLGFTAADTVGNARETAEWARAMRYHSLIVVTTDYHMPRAMLELRAVLREPDVRLQTYPVATPALKSRRWWRNPRAARLMVTEYCKYLAILGREAVLGLGPPSGAGATEGLIVLAVRSVLFVALFYAWSIIVVVAILPLILGPTRWMVACWAVWARVIMLLLRVVCGIRVELRGRQHMPRDGALIAAKHQCMFDVFAQFAWLPFSCFVMKKELAWLPFFGWYARKAKVIIVDREGHSAALRKMVAEAKQRFAEGRQVVIFPEGTRTAPGQPGDYKPGIAALYRELAAPVHPIATNAGVHWPRKGLLRRPGTIVFEYLEPIPAGLKRAEFMRVLQERIDTASNALLPL